LKKIFLFIFVFANFIFSQIEVIQKYIVDVEKIKEQGKLLVQKKIIPEAIYTIDREIKLLGADENRLYYYTTFNRGGALTHKVFRLYTNGGRGVSITGNGYNKVAIWDGGLVRTTHQEFGGRVSQLDGATTLSSHATHVSGTICASGINSYAKGMAYQTNLKTFDWDNDISEMTTQAQNGLELSNHSYGFLAGWYYGDMGQGTAWYWFGTPSISQTEDYQFGYYSSYAQSVDALAFSYPNYLIIKAAGNDRGEGPASGSFHYYWNGSAWVSSYTTRNLDGNLYGYDCISDYGVAKNVLTVGAVQQTDFYTSPSDVTMTSFSGWGPVDDGRIKPDIVAKGYNVYSTNSTGDAAYTTMSGTSMATPTVTGALVLLKQLYQNLKSTTIKSATLKALVIHTADECGDNPGPDYKFGWGLLNVDKAALVIKKSTIDNNTIIESNLLQNQTYTLNVVAAGNEPLKVTLCWTDPAKNPLTSNKLNNRSARLVNNLDLEIDYNSNIYYPWKLDPDNPSNPATNNSKNNVDNVEVVEIPNPIAGATYTIKVTHTGTLQNSNQNFSLIVTGNLVANKIFVDGKSFDWTGTALSSYHSTTYSAGQFIYTGKSNDERTDYNSTQPSSNADITEVRFATDNTYLYGFVKLRDITNINYPHLCFVFTNSSSNNNFIGDDSYRSNTNSSSATALVNSVQYGKVVDIHCSENYKPTIEIYNGTNWTAPSPDFEVNFSSVDDIIEFKINLSDLGLTSTQTTKISFMTTHNSVGWNNNIDATAWATDNQTNGVDVMTPNSADNNAWARDLSDGEVDYYATINLTQVPLTAEISSFSYKIIDDKVKLLWNTASELNNKGFYVEKNVANSWITLGFVDGKGNSNVTNSYEFTDNSQNFGKVTYRLKQVDFDGQFTYSNTIEVNAGLPKELILLQNYPNPFNPTTTISYAIPVAGNINVKIYNSLGQEVATLYNGYQEAGIKQLNFNANKLNSGIYYCVVNFGKSNKVIKMLLIK